MAETRLQGYLDRLKNELNGRGISNAGDVLEEIESHLLDSVDQGLRQGLSLEEAQRRALDRFGPPGLIAASFEKEKKEPMQKILFAGSVLLGLLIAYIDSRPTWDDTGITVMALLAGGVLIGLLSGRRPWLFALAFGIWIPLWNIYKTHSLNLLPVLIFPVAAVYAGWALRKVIQKTLHSGQQLSNR